MPSGEAPFVTAESSQVDAACTIFPPVQGAASRSEFEAGDALTRPHREGSELVVGSPDSGLLRLQTVLGFVMPEGSRRARVLTFTSRLRVVRFARSCSRVRRPGRGVG
jgi:hypothetical protein